MLLLLPIPKVETFNCFKNVSLVFATTFFYNIFFYEQYSNNNMPKDVDEVSRRRRDQLINEQIDRHVSSSSQSRNVREVYPAHEFDDIVPHDAAKQYGNIALCEETEGNNSVPCASSQAEQAVYASRSTASANILPCNVIDKWRLVNARLLSLYIQMNQMMRQQ